MSDKHSDNIYCISYDIGTTGVKTCVFEISDRVRLLAGASEGYSLYVMPNGGAEQDPDEWWNAMIKTTRAALDNAKIKKEYIKGISFCSQMQGLVLVDKEGTPVHRAFSYMDQRATQELHECMQYGPQIAGGNITKVLKALKATGAVALSVKDPVWKYNWVKKHEPENFKRVYKWLDVKEYLISRMTGEFVMTPDSAFGALMYDIHTGKWNDGIARMYGVYPSHLPKIVKCTDRVGGLRKKQAEELGLCEDTAVYGGGGDATLIGVGAGAVDLGDTHIYSGTSGWVSTVTNKSIVDTSAMIAAVVGAKTGYYNYFAELETAGKCIEWVKNHLALDEINIYMQHDKVLKRKKVDREVVFTNLYDYMWDVINDVPAGANGVIFTPWLHGNRMPFEDPNSRGMFFNLSLDTGKSDMIRAVFEGVCYHMRWFLETEDKKLKTSQTVRYVGGGAISPHACQIMADITGKIIETVESPQNIGAAGAAILIAVGTGHIADISDAKRLIPANASYYPTSKDKAVYDRNYRVFKRLWKCNKESFEALNASN